MKILAFTKKKLNLDNADIIYMEENMAANRIVAAIKEHNYELIIFDDDMEGSISSLNSLVDINDLFPVMYLTEQLERFPNLNPFKCVSQEEMEMKFTISQMQATVNNYKKKIEENYKFLTEIQGTGALDFKTENKFLELKPFYKKTSWGELELPKFESQFRKSLDNMIAISEELLDKLKKKDK